MLAPSAVARKAKHVRDLFTAIQPLVTLPVQGHQTVVVVCQDFRCQGVGCRFYQRLFYLRYQNLFAPGIFQGTSTSFVQQPSSTAPAPASSTAVIVVPTTPSVSTTATPKPSSSYSCSTGWFSCHSESWWRLLPKWAFMCHRCLMPCYRFF